MKLPVTKAIATTFAFTLENWIRLIRIIWLPFVLSFVLIYAFQLHIISRTNELLAQGPNLAYQDALDFNSQIFWMNLGVTIISAALGLMMTAGILRLVIRGESPSLPFNFRWGGDEWTLLGTCVALGAMFFLIFFLVAVVLGVLAGLLTSVAWVVMLVPLIVFCGMIWLAVRFYLALPAAIGREQLGIGPSWEASSGQFWRLLGFLLLLGLASLVFQLAVMAAITPDILGIYYEGITQGIPAEWVNMRVQETLAFDTPFGALRIVALWLCSLVPTLVGTVALGVAWRLIDDEAQKPKVRVEGSASDVMGF